MQFRLSSGLVPKLYAPDLYKASVDLNKPIGYLTLNAYPKTLMVIKTDESKYLTDKINPDILLAASMEKITIDQYGI